MTIPTRWHKPSCDTPQVVVDGNVPQCRACGSSALALLQKAAEEPAPSYSGIKLPPETPIGKMDLWWPPCVPYTRNGASRAQPSASFGDGASLAPQASDSSLSEIYTSTLGQDHFRLLYISGARAIDSPIHGTLVNYERENCPEYETASYTWGGEDGDATPCKPGYFGDFWDLLFLTRNCWSLLRYLRPHMGTRVVWVDAICINQNNIQERGAQVSIMTHIYRNCQRVVIYPGDHLVLRDEHRFRARIRHDDITERDGLYYVDGSGFDIWDSVSKSRYINRVWIIQELILPPSSTLALKYHDLYLDNSLLHRVAKDGERKWLEFMGQSYRFCQTSFYEALRMTSDSQATDPRDKIFGILGVLGPNPTYSEIRPDYSISMRDCVIGAIGLILLISKEFWPLLNSPKSNTISEYPSWLPSLDDIASWKDDSKGSLDSRDTNRISHEIRGNWRTFIKLGEHDPNQTYMYTRPLIGNASEDDGGFRDPLTILIGPQMSWYQGGSIDSSTGALNLRLVRLFDTAHELVEGPYLEEYIQEMERTLGPSINNWDLKNRYYHVKGPSSAICFATTKKPLRLKQPCHLFLAFHVKAPRPRNDIGSRTSLLPVSETFLLFADEDKASENFKLLGCCRVDDAILYSESRLRPRSLNKLSQVMPRLHKALSLFDILTKSLNYKPGEHRRHGGGLETTLFDLILPGQEDTIPGLLQIGLAVARIGERSAVTEEFRRAYTACLQSRSGEFNPVLDDQYVWFTLVDDDAMGHFGDCLLQHFTDAKRNPDSQFQWRPWNEIFPPWFDLQIPDIGNTEYTGEWCPSGERGFNWGGRDFYWKHVHPPGQNVSNIPNFLRHRYCGQHWDHQPHDLTRWLPCAQEPKKLQMPVRAKMPLKDIVEAIRQTKLHWFLRYLLALSDKVSENAEHLLARGPQPEDSNIYLHDWPKSLVDELGFVWRNELVTFV